MSPLRSVISPVGATTTTAGVEGRERELRRRIAHWIFPILHVCSDQWASSEEKEAENALPIPNQLTANVVSLWCAGRSLTSRIESSASAAVWKFSRRRTRIGLIGRFVWKVCCPFRGGCWVSTVAPSCLEGLCSPRRAGVTLDEDPFDHSHNLSKGVGIRAFRYIIENFRRARLHFATPLQGQSLDLASRSAEDASKVFFNPEKLASEEEAPGKPNCFSVCFNSRRIRNVITYTTSPPLPSCAHRRMPPPAVFSFVKCGKPGHRSIACPDQVCFRCNKKGHRKIDCPNKKSLRLCHFCNEPGHERAQCPKNKDGGRRQRYGAGPRGFAKGARQRK